MLDIILFTMTLLQIFQQKGWLDNERNILAEDSMNTSVKPHEVKMYVKRNGSGQYFYTFESHTGVIQWVLMDRPDDEVREGACKWYATPGIEPLGECQDCRKDEVVLELVARTMVAFDKGFIPEHDHAILDKGSRIDLLRYLTRNTNRYQKLCGVFSK